MIIHDATLDGRRVDCYIRNGIIESITPTEVIDEKCGEEVVEAKGDYLVPPFYNCHTHSPMNLLRGYADDLELFTWLKEHIWPFEAKMKAEDIRRGAMLSIEEMIRSGTVFYNDMYWNGEEALYAAAKSGMRAVIGLFLIDTEAGKIHPRCEESCKKTLEVYRSLTEEERSRIRLSYAPHAVYSCSEKTLRKAGEWAMEDGAFIHVHASETETEVSDCLREHGMTPIAWLDYCGLLTPKTILAHCVHLSDGDMRLIAERRAVISHQPCSNYKLCSGQFNYRDVVEKFRCRFVLGTDGCASNNNLSLFEEMKFAALNAKVVSGDPTVASAAEIFWAATRGAAEAFQINGGVIMPGAVGDALLIRRDAPQMVPCHNLVSNLVYSADTSCISAVICAGVRLY